MRYSEIQLYSILLAIKIHGQAFRNYVLDYDQAHNVHINGVMRAQKSVHGTDFSM